MTSETKEPERIWVEAQHTRGEDIEYIHTTAIAQVVNALRELKTCVEDGCYCSEMRLATAIDEANAVLKLIGPTQ